MKNKKNDQQVAFASYSYLRQQIGKLKEQLKQSNFSLKFADNLLRRRYSDIDQAKKQIKKKDQIINELSQENENLTKILDDLQYYKQNDIDDDSIDDCEVCGCKDCQTEDDNDDELKFDIQDLLPYNEISKKIQMLNDKVDSVVNVTQSILEIIEQIFCQPHNARITWIVEKDD